MLITRDIKREKKLIFPRKLYYNDKVDVYRNIIKTLNINFWPVFLVISKTHRV